MKLYDNKGPKFFYDYFGRANISKIYQSILTTESYIVRKGSELRSLQDYCLGGLVGWYSYKDKTVHIEIEVGEWDRNYTNLNIINVFHKTLRNDHANYMAGYNVQFLLIKTMKTKIGFIPIINFKGS